MSEILARIRVRETAGIRRFLYPLTVHANLPLDTHLQLLRLSDEKQDIPLQATHTGSFRLDFAVFLDPYAERELALTTEVSSASLDDPLYLDKQYPEGLLRSQQQRFSIAVPFNGLLSEVIYDDVMFLKTPLQITRNGETGNFFQALLFHVAPDFSKVAAWVSGSGRYPDGTACGTKAELTACKSWATSVP